MVTYSQLWEIIFWRLVFVCLGLIWLIDGTWEKLYKHLKQLIKKRNKQ